jgi:hypothetical protein
MLNITTRMRVRNENMLSFALYTEHLISSLDFGKFTTFWLQFWLNFNFLSLWSFSRYLKLERQSSIKSMETYFSLFALRQIVANSIVMTQIVSLTYLEYKVSLIRQTLFISLSNSMNRTSITIYDIHYYLDTYHYIHH